MAITTLKPEILQALQNLGNEEVENMIRKTHPELLPEIQELPTFSSIEELREGIEMLAPLQFTKDPTDIVRESRDNAATI